MLEGWYHGTIRILEAQNLADPIRIRVRKTWFYTVFWNVLYPFSSNTSNPNQDPNILNLDNPKKFLRSLRNPHLQVPVCRQVLLTRTHRRRDIALRTHCNTRDIKCSSMLAFIWKKKYQKNLRNKKNTRAVLSFQETSEFQAGVEYRISVFSNWPISSWSDSGCYVPGFP